MSIKPVVEFINKPVFVKRTLTDPAMIHNSRQFLDETNSYEHAKVYTMNHPVWGEEFVRTSIVIKKNSDGSFETLNTIYKPVIEEDHI